MSRDTFDFVIQRIELERAESRAECVGEGWGKGDELSEACEREPETSGEFRANLRTGMGEERWPLRLAWLSLGDRERQFGGLFGRCSKQGLSKDGEGRESEKEGLPSCV